MERTRLEKVLELHKLWLENKEGGCCANLSGANLIRANLSCANLSCADLRGADLRGANLSCANLSCANLRCANLSGANLIRANLSCANLSGADLSGADLSGADLRGANLSGAKELLSAIAYIDAHFERTENGYIAYKTFGAYHKPPESWVIEPDSVITENVAPNRTDTCGSGINVAPLKWVKNESSCTGPIWKVLIEWPWLAGVVVPYGTDGKIRCEKVRLLEVVE